MHPIVQDVASTAAVRVVDLQVDESPDVTDQLGIRSVPTLIAVRDGVEVGRLVGAQSRPAIESLFGAASDGATRVRSAAPGLLAAARVGAGAALATAGFALDALALIAAGSAVTLWGLVGVVRRVATARTRRST
jgi:thioredoxin-like negative regulator of GroEL